MGKVLYLQYKEACLTRAPSKTLKGLVFLMSLQLIVLNYTTKFLGERGLNS